MEEASWRILLSIVLNPGNLAKVKESFKELGFRELWSSGAVTLFYYKCVCLLYSQEIQQATSFLAPKREKKSDMLGQEAPPPGDPAGPEAWWLLQCVLTGKSAPLPITCGATASWAAAASRHELRKSRRATNTFTERLTEPSETGRHHRSQEPKLWGTTKLRGRWKFDQGMGTKETKVLVLCHALWTFERFRR